MELNQYVYDGLSPYLGAEALNRAKEEADKSRSSLLDALQNDKRLDQNDLARKTAALFHLPFVNVSVYNLDDSLLKDIPPSLIRETEVIPWRSLPDKSVLCVAASPFKAQEMRLYSYFLKCPLKLGLSSVDGIRSLISNLTGKERRNQANEEFSKEFGKQENAAALTLNDYVNAPSVLLADTLLQEAVNARASDIHIEPMEKSVRVRFRIDGILLHHCDIDPNLYLAVVARYKILANLDISERRLPQDGKLTRTLNDHAYDFRISTLPNIYGEKVVIRIFNTLGDETSIDQLANTPLEAKMFREMLSSPHGILMCTGPTGAGKTTTLYSFLKELNRPGVNVQTVEDPVENQMEGVNQLQVNTKTGLTFASALRSILRQDPDIIMIGEIRDEESAHIAVQAAITGHLVLTTIHTNDAVTTITRLIDMGVEPYLVADSLIGAISQRLVRKLCPDCKKEHLVNEPESLLTGLPVGTKIYEKCGCEHCNHTGYIGRTAVYEIMAMNEKMRGSIDTKNFSFEKTKDIVTNDPSFISLKQAAAKLVKDGVTTIEEFDRLISQEVEEIY